MPLLIKIQPMVLYLFNSLGIPLYRYMSYAIPFFHPNKTEVCVLNLQQKLCGFNHHFTLEKQMFFEPTLLYTHQLQDWPLFVCYRINTCKGILVLLSTLNQYLQKGYFSINHLCMCPKKNFPIQSSFAKPNNFCEISA